MLVSRRRLTHLLIVTTATAIILIIQGLLPILFPPSSTIYPLPSATYNQTPILPTSAPQQLILVTKVIDGDTIEIEGGEKVRLIGIDTPETVDPRRPVGCFGAEASAQTKALVEGKRVSFEGDITNLDKYGRQLRYVWIGNLFVNEYLVRQGFAYSYPYPPDVKYQGLFDAAEVEAKAQNRGLWGICYNQLNAD